MKAQGKYEKKKITYFYLANCRQIKKEMACKSELVFFYSNKLKGRWAVAASAIRNYCYYKEYAAKSAHD